MCKAGKAGAPPKASLLLAQGGGCGEAGACLCSCTQVLALCIGRGPLELPLAPLQFAAVMLMPIVPLDGELNAVGLRARAHVHTALFVRAAPCAARLPPHSPLP